MDEINWKKFFDRLGMNGTVWQWKIVRFQQNLNILKKNLPGKYSSQLYRNRACKCGAILEKNDKTCPRCGVRTTPYSLEIIKRMAGLETYYLVPATALFVFLSITDFIFITIQEKGAYLFSPSGKALLLAGAQMHPLNGEWWRLITSIFVHIGLIHLGFNMIALIRVGPVMERMLGFRRYFSIFLFTGLISSVATMRFLPNSISAGASGALFGLIGMGIIYFHRIAQPTVRNFFIRWAIYGLVFGMAIRANNIAHIAGAIAGIVTGFLLESTPEKSKIIDNIWFVFSIILGILLLISFIILIHSVTIQSVQN